MSKRIHPSYVVFDSIENDEHDRCVDLFRRSDGTWGFEEFRRDVEDSGAWTAVAAYSFISHPTKLAAWTEAQRCVRWLATVVRE